MSDYAPFGIDDIVTTTEQEYSMVVVAIDRIGVICRWVDGDWRDQCRMYAFNALTLEAKDTPESKWLREKVYNKRK